MRRIFSQAGRGAVIAVVAALAFGGAAQADPGLRVTGGYSYIVFEGAEPAERVSRGARLGPGHDGQVGVRARPG